MDMFMKNLKTLVHSIHSELKESIPSFKKGHIHELVSAYLGYGSYAAYQVDLSFNKVSNDTNEIAKGQCFDRALELSFDASTSLLASQCIARQLDISLQSKIQLEKVFLYLEDLESYDELNNVAILDSLKSLIDEGLCEAYLLAIIICAKVISAFKDNPDNRSGEYWYNKKSSGSTLNSLQSEVADNFVFIKSFIVLIKFALTEENILLLPRPLSIKPIVDRFEENKKQAWTTFYNDSPYDVLETLDFLYEFDDSINSANHNQAFMDWLACEIVLSPTRDNLAEKLNSCESDSEKWFWYYFGLEHDIDITQDDYYAINAYTGEEYDDYGPMEVAGYTGIALPNISDELKAEVKVLSKSLFCD